jgi:hypothetical protein
MTGEAIATGHKHAKAHAVFDTDGLLPVLAPVLRQHETPVDGRPRRPAGYRAWR